MRICLNNRGVIIASVVVVCLVSVSPPIVAQEETESRMQAVLKLNGTFLSTGGLQVTEEPSSGPAANLALDDPNRSVRGILEKGDLITEIDGQAFQDRREFLDLMNEAYQKNNGKVRLTVKDVTTGRSVYWIARPELARMNVPVASRPFDFLESLGKPVPAAKPVPAVPATLEY